MFDGSVDVLKAPLAEQDWNVYPKPPRIGQSGFCAFANAILMEDLCSNLGFGAWPAKGQDRL